MKNLIIICFCSFITGAFAMPTDSIGTKVVDGKLYIMHKVTKGEGVYGISKKYGVSAKDIYAANEGSDESIKIGQVLLIPKGVSTASSSGNSSSSTVKTEKKYHTVEKGQTLSTIARLHGTTVANIKELNKLKSDNIQLGQKLIVGEKTTQVAASKPAPPKPAVAAKTTENENSTKTNNNQTPVTQNEPQKNVVVDPSPVSEIPISDKPGVVNTTYSTDDGDEISESGLASISTDGDLAQERSFICHPTAKIGTIVMITNPANNNTVFARVVGNCKAESGYILKMSKTVATKLGVSENTEVKVSYAK